MTVIFQVPFNAKKKHDRVKEISCLKESRSNYNLGRNMNLFYEFNIINCSCVGACIGVQYYLVAFAVTFSRIGFWACGNSKVNAC